MIFPQDLEHFIQVTNMVVNLLGLHQHIIHIHLHGPSDQILEHHINQTLVGRSSVLQSERHHLIVV